MESLSDVERLFEIVRLIFLEPERDAGVHVLLEEAPGRLLDGQEAVRAVVIALLELEEGPQEAVDEAGVLEQLPLEEEARQMHHRDQRVMEALAPPAQGEGIGEGGDRLGT